MQEYGFSLTLIFVYKDRMDDFVLTLKTWVKENPYSRIFYTNKSKAFCVIYLQFQLDSLCRSKFLFEISSFLRKYL